MYRDEIRSQVMSVNESNKDRQNESPTSQREVVLSVENLSKKFCKNLKSSMFYGIKDLAKGMVGVEPDTYFLREDEFWALKDINFKVKEGDILGIIGANGSGKSTLLRVLTGIFPPDEGRVWINGTVGGIISLGAGMHPHMTGRENIYLNGTVFGMSKDEIDEKIDEIIEFAEISDFLDAPLSTYSSGMKVRLGFAVAVHSQPEILLVDEVLAVGDLSFQNKCMRKIKEVRENAKAVIFISHSMDNIELICNKVIVLENGYLVKNADPMEGIGHYQDLQNKKITKKSSNKGILKSGEITLRNIEILNSKYNIVEDIEEGNEFYLKYIIDSNIYVENPVISSTIRTLDAEPLIWNRNTDHGSIKGIKKGINEIIVHYIESNLNKGIYRLTFSIKNLDTNEYYLKVTNNQYKLIITSSRIERGPVSSFVEWL